MQERKGFKWKRKAAGAIGFAIVSQLVRSIEAIATMQYYFMENYFPVWSKVMMPTEGAPPAGFYALSFLFALVTGLIYAFVYSKIRGCLPGKNALKKGSYFGALLFLVAGIPFALSLYLLINLPIELILAWAFTSMVVYMAGGILIAKVVGVSPLPAVGRGKLPFR